ncbi:hypothetical protein GCM10009633_14900 [Janibacter melonis]
MQEQHEGPAPGDGEVEARAVGGDEAVLPGTLDESRLGVRRAQRPGLIASTVSCALRIAFFGTGLALVTVL